MTEDASQLSVAELLARNGQQSGAPAGGGGRRRRSGRGISVAELTGDIPVVKAGSSSHAAPDEDVAASAPEPAPNESDYSNFSNYSDYSNFSDYSDFSGSGSPAQPDYSSPAQPDYSSYAPVPDPDPAYSPLSGPISYYNPLAPAPQPPSLPEPSGQNWSAGLDWPPTENPLQPDGRSTGGGRRRKPDPLDADVSPARLNGTETPAPPREGGRRRRYDPEDDTTDEVHPFRGNGATRDAASDAMRDIAARASRPMDSGPRPPLDEPPRTQFNPAAFNPAPRQPFDDAARTQFNPAAQPWAPPGPEPLPRNGRPAFDPPQAPAAPPMSRSARRHAEAQQAPPQAPPGERRGGVDHGAADGLPAWSARRRPGRDDQPVPDQAAVPTAAWSSLADSDQQLLSGESVAGDLMRDAQSREDERNSRAAGNGGKRRGGRGHAPVAPEPEPDDHLTDFYEPLDDDEYEDDYDDEPAPSMGARFSALTRKAGALGRKPGRASSAPARSRAKGRSDEDENRRQWLVIAGQSVGAAVAGMLLFKGFERMWEMLPWVALALAMIVILGLVALVRVLRRTDDIFSTVIAVVVGVFVTLGPLAFLLSTN
ncbi:hypothetical protein ACFXHA_24370 [Nocardia sp. NPDC059240]|uniref:hypothetical protein n=1 Tax=Nocardia sp. NPDC059240 TaxID=3346786 RepID=UPI0036983AA7